MNGVGGAWRTISVALHADAGQYVATLGGASAVTNEFGKTTDNVTTRSGASWASFGKVVALGVGVGLIALTAFIGASIRAASEFEARMAAVQAVSGATGVEMDALRAKALQLGADTSFSAGQAASAMEELVKAGVPVSEVLDGAADATVNLAAAGEVDLVKAAEISASAMNQFGMDAAKLPHVADLVAGAANTSAISVEDFGMSLSQAGSVAALTGASFDDVTVAITAMGNAGIVGADAGTSLKSFLQRLVPTTTEAREEMEKLGIITADGSNRFFDAKGNLKSFDEVAGILQDSLAGLTNEQKLATLQTIYGSDAIRAAAVFADEGAEGWDRLSEAIGNVSAAEVAEQRLNSISGSVEKFKGSVETLLISSGGTFTKLLKPIIDGATEFVNVLAADPSAFFESLRQKLKPLLPFWHDLVDTGENIVDVLAAAWDQGDGLAATFAKFAASGVVGALTLTADVLEKITGFLADNEEAVALVLAALVGLAAAQAWPMIVGAIETMYVKWLVFEGSVGATSITRGLGMIAQEFLTMGRSASGGTTMVIDGLKEIASSAVSGAAIAGGAFAGLAAGYFLATSSMDRQTEKSRKKMQQFVDSLHVDDSDLGGLSRGMDQINTKAQAMLDTASGSNWNDFAQRLSFWSDNDIQDAEDQIAEAERITEDYAKIVEDQNYINTQVMGTSVKLGMDALDVQDWVDKLNLDAAAMTQEEMANAITEAKNAAEQGSPLTDDLAKSYDTLASSTANATEKVDAWKEAMDRALGIKKNVVDARVDFEAGLDDLTSTLTEFGWATGSFDPTTEAGRATISAASSSVDDAIAYVEAITDEQGIEAGAYALAAVREQILQSMESTGMARDVAEEWIDKLGLTPDLVETQVALSDPDGAKEYADDLASRLQYLADLDTTIKLWLDAGYTQAFIDTSIGVSELLSFPPRDLNGNGVIGNRWGGMYSFASGGVTPAHVARGTRYKWAEPETGGEAFLPRFGNLARSESIMGQVAGWYGGTYLPHGTPLPQHQPSPLVSTYQGMTAAEVFQIVAGMERPNVHVEARTDADPQSIADHINRVSLF